MAQQQQFGQVYPIPPDGLLFPAPVHVGASFETGEQATQKVYFPGKVRITRVRAIATKAIAATDNGTITVKDSAGNTIATLTATASDAINTAYDSGVINSGTNNDVVAGGYIQVVAAKTTAGGKAAVFIEYAALPSR